MRIILLAVAMAACISTFAQSEKQWTEADRKYLLENLKRSRDEVIAETKGLSKAQWSFRESPDRWSINEIVEHIAIWELLLLNRISNLINYTEAHPELSASARPDAEALGFIMEEKPHYSPDYTKPFTYTIPMGINDLKNNVAWLLKLREESINYISTTNDDLRAHYFSGDNENPHQTYITLFGHTDRHLRQLRKVKAHANYPKK